MNEQVLLDDGWYWVINNDQGYLWVIKESDVDFSKHMHQSDCLDFRNKTR